MIVNYNEFIMVADERCERYRSIPRELLNAAGAEVVELYGQLTSDICFAQSASELLGIIRLAPQYHFKTDRARREFNATLACLRRLAQNEKGDE